MKTIENIKHYIRLKEFKKKPKRDYLDLIESLCYDREFCRSIGINYNRMNKEDLNKIKDYVNTNVLRRVK